MQVKCLANLHLEYVMCLFILRFFYLDVLVLTLTINSDDFNIAFMPDSILLRKLYFLKCNDL